MGSSPAARIAAALVVIASWNAVAAAATAAAAPRTVVYPVRTMGTFATVALVTADSLASAPDARAAHAVLARVDSLMSNWTQTSEVARLNREAAKRPTRVQPEVATVLDRALELWRASAGAFDITVEPLVRLWGFLGGEKRVPSDAEIAATLPRVGAQRVRWNRASRTVSFDREGVRIDLGGIAKGYGVDVAADTLRARGVRNALVNLSGNMVAIGAPPGAPAWRIGIRDPRDRMNHFARVRLNDGEAISTSGQYEQFVAADGRRYGHILDPRTGRPVEGLISVTVVAKTALECDAWDTPLFVLGPIDARRRAHELTSIAAILVEPGADGIDTVWVEASLVERFALEPEARALFRVAYF